MNGTRERRVRKPTSVVRRGAGGEGLVTQHLACGLPYFLLEFIGPKDEAEAIKQRIATFLHDELHLELSHTKTLITHARSEAARFLGYEVVTIHDDVKRVTTKHSVAKRTLNGKIGLRVPRDVMLAKCERYKQNGKAIHRRELVDDSDFTIMALYQQEFRGIVEYYRLAYNLHTLNQLKWVMETSLTKTLANKYRISVTQVFQKYRAELLVQGQPYKGLQVVIPREGQHPLIAQWGGIPLKWDIQATVEDQPSPIWGKRTELEKRLLAQVCEKCGARDHIEVHHIRALKDLDQHQGRERPAWTRIMAARRRKTLVLCRTCHEDIHAGRPLRRQLSSS